MKMEDEFCRARGFVRPTFLDLATGRRMPFELRHNTLSYMSAEAMAAAFGGDPSYIPAKIGFIYGDQQVMPTESVITRDQSWEKLEEELRSGSESATVDVQVVGFSYSPSLGAAEPEPDPSSSGSSSGSGVDDHGEELYDAGDYCHIKSTGSNAITFHAVSNSQDSGAVSGTEAFRAGMYIYQAVLLGVHDGRKHIISRVSLKEGDKYLRKPDGFEIALDWTVVFK